MVLLKEESIARNQWRTARVEETYPDEDGLVRRVKIVVSDQLSEKGSENAASIGFETTLLIVLMKSQEIEDN